MGTEREGQIDQWQGGSVTPRDHNLKRSPGKESRREERLAEPSRDQPSSRELRRRDDANGDADKDGPGEGGD